MLAVARRLAKNWPAVELTLLDRIDLVSRRDARRISQSSAGASRRSTDDVFEWMQSAGEQRFDAVTANLFLHHFDNADLARLLSGLQRLAPVLVATEPRRGSFPLAAARLLWAIGANDVTLHDAAASVRAGFAGNGTVRPLAAGRGKPLEERRGWLFSHVFAAAGE